MSYRILITGGSGYLGSVLTNLLHLSLLRPEITVIDDLSNSTTQDLPKSVDFIKGSITDEDLLVETILNKNINIVIHLAAVAILDNSLKKRLFDVNSNGTKILLDAMEKTHTYNIIAVSSASVYGHPRSSEGYWDERDICHPFSEYGKSKLMMEKHIQSWADRVNGSYIIFRPFNIAGATKFATERHNPETHIIPRLIESYYNNKEFYLFGYNMNTFDGSCIRDYVHVSEVANAIINSVRYMDIPPIHRGIREIFNIGNGEGISNKQIIDKVETALGGKIKVINHQARQEDPAILIARNMKIKRLLLPTLGSMNIDYIISTAIEYWKGSKKNQIKR